MIINCCRCITTAFTYTVKTHSGTALQKIIFLLLFAHLFFVMDEIDTFTFNRHLIQVQTT